MFPVSSAAAAANVGLSEDVEVMFVCDDDDDVLGHINNSKQFFFAPSPGFPVPTLVM